MQKKVKFIACTALLITALTAVNASDLTKTYEMPDATKILEKDLLKPATTYTLPKSCNLNDTASIARGEYIFHNLNGDQAKDAPPEGIVKSIEKDGKKEPKQYGNCVACHNIEGEWAVVISVRISQTIKRILSIQRSGMHNLSIRRSQIRGSIIRLHI
jgi:sulfur-oxidizing protein SoxX